MLHYRQRGSRPARAAEVDRFARMARRGVITVSRRASCADAKPQNAIAQNNALPIQTPMRRPHLFGHFPRRLDIHQPPLPDARTSFARLMPRPVRPQYLRPIRKRRALQRLRLMHGTSSLPQEGAVGVPRHSQPPQVLRPIHVFPLELVRREPQILRQSHNIRLGQIHEPLLFAALRASRLALEADLQLPCL